MIRPATPADLPAVLAVYRSARTFMAAQGNPDQWGEDYPYPDVVQEDIRLHRLYVDESAGHICGVFAFLPEGDPVYAHLSQGAWHSDAPHAAIHRVASDGSVPGVFARCLDFCRSRRSHLRMDTHARNHPMQACLSRAGFVPCGTIHTPEDGMELLVFELI